MSEDYLSDDAYKFYAEFKKYSKQNIISEVMLGAKERKVRIKNGKDLAEYNGSQEELRRLMRRINRNLNQDNDGVIFITIIKNNNNVNQCYKEWDEKRANLVLNTLKGKGKIKDFNITKFKN